MMFSRSSKTAAAFLAATSIMLEHSNLYAMGVQMDCRLENTPQSNRLGEPLFKVGQTVTVNPTFGGYKHDWCDGSCIWKVTNVLVFKTHSTGGKFPKRGRRPTTTETLVYDAEIEQG